MIYQIKRFKTEARLGVALVAWAICGSALGQVEVVVATAGPKSDVGLIGDSVGLMYHFSVSPDGRWWAGHFELEDALDSFHLRGQGLSFSDVLWIETQALPGATNSEFDASTAHRQTSINNSGDVAGIAGFRVQGVTSGELVYRYEGVSVDVLALTGQAMAALPQANYGLDLISPNVDSNGVVSFYADNIAGVGVTTATDALTVADDGAVFGGQQKGLTNYAGSALFRIDPDRYVVESSGTDFIFSGDTTGDTASDDIVVMGSVGSEGSVVLQENVTQVTTSSGVEVFDVASNVLIGGNDWFAAGDTVAGTGVVLRNGVVLASEGDFAPNGFRYAGDPVTIAADDSGNYAWVWQTDNPDIERALIMVYNGSSILLTEHDTLLYDANADGELDEIRMDRLFDDVTDFALAGGYAYFMTELDDPVTTVFVGDGFLRVPVELDEDGDGVTDSMDNCIETANADQRDTNNDGYGNVCDADINNDGTINVVDLGLLRSVFFGADEDADFNGDGVVNVIDLGLLRSAFFGAPGPSGLLRSPH